MNQNSFDYKKYPGFTLVEMLIVMAIFAALSALGIFALGGLRETIVLNETSQTIQQDIRWAQRAATLVKRDEDEKWLYGIGVDLRTLGTEREYKIFKWCSQYNEYEDGGTDTSGEYPNGDGQMPITYGEESDCDQGDQFTTQNGLIVEINGGSTDIDEMLVAGWPVDSNRTAIVLFEAVTGNPFFYDENGKRVPFENLEFVLSTLDGNATSITIKRGSGKIETKKVLGADNYSYDEPVDFGDGGNDDDEEEEKGPVCPNGTCEGALGEDIRTCPQDCLRESDIVCGDGYCQPPICFNDISDPIDTRSLTENNITPVEVKEICYRGETEYSCPEDCRESNVCGNNECEIDLGENEKTCPQDCSEYYCGNDTCDLADGESKYNCYADCNWTCGDELCEEDKGETIQECFIDCVVIDEPYCGDGICSRIENEDSCPKDCDDGDTIDPIDPGGDLY